MHTLNTLTFTPRFEMSQIDFGLPVTVDGYTNLTAGMYLRLGPLFVGSTNCWNAIVGSSIRGLNLYSGLKIPITFGTSKKPKKLHTPKLSNKTPKEEKVDSTTLALRQAEIEHKAEQDKAWAIEQERLIREAAEEKPILLTSDTIPSPKSQPKINIIPTPEPLVEPESEYYDVKKGENAIKEVKAYFQSNSAWIASADRAKLDILAKDMQAEPKYHAVIHGYTDNVGDPESNKKLADKRARKVKEYLEKQGVDSSKLTLTAKGAQSPAAENDTPEGREKNRRVEILLLKDK